MDAAPWSSPLGHCLALPGSPHTERDGGRCFLPGEVGTEPNTVCLPIRPCPGGGRQKRTPGRAVRLCTRSQSYEKLLQEAARTAAWLWPLGRCLSVSGILIVCFYGFCGQGAYLPPAASRPGSPLPAARLSVNKKGKHMAILCVSQWNQGGESSGRRINTLQSPGSVPLSCPCLCGIGTAVSVYAKPS